MELIQDLVVSEIRLPVSVYHRLKTFKNGLQFETDPLTLAINGWEVSNNVLKCKECTGNAMHDKNCIYNGNIQYNFPELDAGSVLACFIKRAKGLQTLKINVSEKGIDTSLIKTAISDTTKLLSLFGWEFKSSDSITCFLCDREVGIWKIVDVEKDHRYWCPWVRDCKRKGWEVTFDKLTRKSLKPSFQVQDASQVYDWLNSIMPT